MSPPPPAPGRAAGVRNERRHDVFNGVMNRIVKSLALGATTLVALLAGATSASAEIIQIGAVEPGVTPSCPSPCIAISRTTGYQAQVGTSRGIFYAPANGRIVAWTIALGAPSEAQQRFFTRGFGGTSRARITVLRREKKVGGRIVAQSPDVDLTPYFGSTVQFPLEQSLKVAKGNLVALTVPTWAPALAVGLGRDSSWRASRPNRPRGECLDTETQTARTVIGGTTRFACFYQTARLTYTATLITDPAPTPKPKPSS